MRVRCVETMCVYNNGSMVPMVLKRSELAGRAGSRRLKMNSQPPVITSAGKMAAQPPSTSKSGQAWHTASLVQHAVGWKRQRQRVAVWPLT